MAMEGCGDGARIAAAPVSARSSLEDGCMDRVIDETR